MFDPRQGGKAIASHKVHAGSKAQRFSWCGNTSRYMSVGFGDGNSNREYGLWDMR